MYDYGGHMARAVSTERFNPSFSKKLDRGGPYKQYSLKDYKELQQQTANLKRGGLGANIYTDDWIKKKEKIEKMKVFAESVRVSHVKGIPLSEVRKPRPDEVKFENYTRNPEETEANRPNPQMNQYVLSHRNKFNY